MSDIQAELEKLRTENTRLKAMAASTTKALSIKISEKGCICVYGLNAQYPVSLYKEQWNKLLAISEDIKRVISENDEQLTLLGDASRQKKLLAKVSLPTTAVRFNQPVRHVG